MSGTLLGAFGFVLGIGGHPDNPGLVAVETTETLDALPQADVVPSRGASTTTTPSVVPASACPAGMVEVQGDFCPFVEQRCLRWLDPETKMRCAEFAPTGECRLRTIPKHFCVDQYEYPNSPGAKPSVMVTWKQAREACAAEGKRLCGEQEWTLACEGSERLPYPYGHARDADACNIDRPHPNLDERLLADPRTRDAEVARLDQREPSGAHASCVSPFGAYDMTGNVDEWVVNESGRPYKSGLKGGYWGRVRNRCRPTTIAHDESFAFYQIGFRCCSDPGAATHTPPVARSVSAPELLASVVASRGA
ncbi:MAG TPA: SUMF1/EgtB/PvdO family nonheme iron enzyme [Polyangiaceae bacterium]|nr:SUMF1/EgtB/PvdO family nonheme iron enzyme [Polyangiaceae bacterium]